MRIPAALISIVGLVAGTPAESAQVVYQNNFDSPASLDDFLIGNIGSSTQPNNVAVEDGKLRISLGNSTPSGTYVAVRPEDYASSYSSILENNAQTVIWAFNVHNADGALNNGFGVAFASSAPDPRIYTSTSYYFSGGGMVRERMALFRQVGLDRGGPSLDVIIDIEDGLANFPQIGSFRATFEPSTGKWDLYGTMGDTAVDPSTVNDLLGTVIDDTFTGASLPYFSLFGSTTGNVYFDNVSISIVPEPGTSLLVGLSSLLLAFTRRRA